uniref:Uncharacterized protein n=1 Tax=Knipowitschia caucasica TaxID=637954 RepID=A0AAV2K310_KNICA
MRDATASPLPQSRNKTRGVNNRGTHQHVLKNYIRPHPGTPPQTSTRTSQPGQSDTEKNLVPGQDSVRPRMAPWSPAESREASDGLVVFKALRHNDLMERHVHF